jgi:hypothetical protein
MHLFNQSDKELKKYMQSSKSMRGKIFLTSVDNYFIFKNFTLFRIRK